MKSSLEHTLEELRALLLRIDPTGADGFEGLVATALAASTGFVFRLARSGLQFGRDASTATGAFAIAMEAKRIEESPRLQDIAGKAVLAEDDLAGKLDVWVLGATCEVAEAIERRLFRILDKRGVALILLDWTPRPLPPLAVLLAASSDAVCEWFRSHSQGTHLERLSAYLDTIASHTSYPTQRANLQDRLTSSNVGLAGLRRSNSEWLRARFADRDLARTTFNQFINTADCSTPAIPRPALLGQLGAAATAAAHERTLLAILGDEGVGKTWLVAQWWENLPDPPVMILVAGRRKDLLDPSSPLRSLARLLAEEEGRSGEEAVDSWARRLNRWQQSDPPQLPRFILVLDGLNEDAHKPWADILGAFKQELQRLGGLVVATCREAFWRREVPIRSTFTASIITVTEYSNEELTAKLAQVGKSPGDLSPQLRAFIRNPRVCAVAISLLQQLKDQPGDLTRERLLLEYWRSRLQERGDLIAHNPEDFEKLLCSHASRWLASPRQPFDRDDWTTHSGPARRRDPRGIFNDLTEIEEGRFFRATASGQYEFRSETLPFALGMLIADEVRTAPAQSAADCAALLDGMLDPIRGFDLAPDIVASATGLACINHDFPESGRLALVQNLLELQQLAPDAIATVSTYVPQRPQTFVALAELPKADALMRHRLLHLLLNARDHATVQQALQPRLPRWLGQWSRRAQTIWQGDMQAERQSSRETKITQALADLLPDERALFEQVSLEVPEAPPRQLRRAAALLMAGRPLEQLADGLVGWAFAQAVAGDVDDATEQLAWVVRLNRVDYAQTATAVNSTIAAITPASSETARWASAMAHDLLGTRSAASRRDSLVNWPHGERWRRVELFCDTNPHDPEAEPGSNLDKAREVARKTEPLHTWSHFAITAEDYNLEDVTPALARFEPQLMVDILRQIVRSIESRSQVPFRQLGWRLPQLSPLYDQSTLRAVEEAYRRLVSHSDVVRKEDRPWLTGQLIAALAPYLDAQSQLDLFLQSPPGPLYLASPPALEPLSAEALETRLEHAQCQSDTHELRWVLRFASLTTVALTDRTRAIIAAQLRSADEQVAGQAWNLVLAARDSELNELALAMVQDTPNSYRRAADSVSAPAIAAAIVEQGRGNLVHLVAPPLLGYVAAALGGPAIEAFANQLDLTISRLLQPVTADAPRDIQLTVRVSADGSRASRRAVDRITGSSDEESEFLIEDLFSSDLTIERFETRQQEIAAEVEAFDHQLAAESAEALMRIPPRDGVLAILRRDPLRCLRWLDQILETSDPNLLSQVYGVVVVVAGCYTEHDGDKARAVLLHLQPHPSRIEFSPGGLPLYDQVLFRASKIPAVQPLLEHLVVRACDDGNLEMAVRGADTFGASMWLDDYIRRLLKSDHPGDNALAITMAGLRTVNEVSEEILAGSHESGFLGDVATQAAKNYRRDRWARHWHESALHATDPVDWWRFGTLLEGVADWRFTTWFRSSEPSDLMMRFGTELEARLSKAAEKRTKKRRETLFGIKVPDPELRAMLFT